MSKPNPWAPAEAKTQAPRRETPNFERVPIRCVTHGETPTPGCDGCGRYVALHCGLCGAEYKGHERQPTEGVYRARYTGGVLIHDRLVYRCICTAGKRKSPKIPDATPEVVEALR